MLICKDAGPNERGQQWLVLAFCAVWDSFLESSQKGKLGKLHGTTGATLCIMYTPITPRCQHKHTPVDHRYM